MRFMLDVAQALTSFPTGRYGIAVSGGADSVALLRLALMKPGLQVHIIHLDHETRAGESRRDSEFVEHLAARLSVPCMVAPRTDVEPSLTRRSRNRSDHFRRCRYTLYLRAVLELPLDGVLVAHHRNDVAETVALRLLRGTGYRALGAMRAASEVYGVRVVRPLLEIAPEELRRFLVSLGQDWREDSSNRSAEQLRNRIRRLLTGHPSVTEALLGLSGSVLKWKSWIDAQCPKIEPHLNCRMVATLVKPVAHELLARWLRQNSPANTPIERRSIDRLLEMCTDASADSRQTFGRGVQIQRKRGHLVPRLNDPLSPADVRGSVE
jgi:tRNA(Ile)-lysidine synthetase-like protein